MVKSFEKRGLTKKSENISDWYHDVVLRAGLADYSDVKGLMIIKPYGYAIWEKVQSVLDGWFKKAGVQNVYFPIFIPMSLLQKEKEHLKGFSPELAVVTIGGGEELTEPLAVRPTSETIMYKTFSDWVQSYRDLPFKINQWANVVRWEKRTYPFLRTTEFLWQEGHTVHENDANAMAMALEALEWYKKFYEEYFAISVYTGIKSESEKFAGAKTTYSIEIVVPDGKALQAATSHNLGDNFAKVFDIQYLDNDGQKRFGWQTSWGLSTRSIGALILSHGDDSGLIMPPRIAPQQVVVLGVNNPDLEKKREIDLYVTSLANTLNDSGIRAVTDVDFTRSFGTRINDWELKGCPLRLEIGAKELQKNEITYIRRDTLEKGSIHSDSLINNVTEILSAIQLTLFNRSDMLKTELTVDADSYDQFKKIMSERKSFIRAFWCENPQCEAKIKEETKASTRILELDRLDYKEEGQCILCGKKSSHKWLFAQSY